MGYWVTEADRQGYRELVHAKVRELRKAADDNSKAVFSPTSPEYPFVAVLVSGIVGCCQAEAIAEGLEFEPDFVNEVVARFRASFLWNEDEYIGLAELVDNEAAGDATFYLHLNVANGSLRRLENGNYTITTAGIRHVESLMKKDRK